MVAGCGQPCRAHIIELGRRSGGVSLGGGLTDTLPGPIQLVRGPAYLQQEAGQQSQNLLPGVCGPCRDNPSAGSDLASYKGKLSKPLALSGSFLAPHDSHACHGERVTSEGGGYYSGCLVTGPVTSQSGSLLARQPYRAEGTQPT